jgi:GNAT superfamily N-acetyltransferase
MSRRPRAAGASAAGSADAGPRVRPARADDVEAVVEGLERLLHELSGDAPGRGQMRAAVGALINDPELGCLLLAEAHGKVIGFLAASWQFALHIPGRYCILQDLWVVPEWRSRGIGGALLRGLHDTMAEREIDRVEVGLPSARFVSVAATKAFYLNNGYSLIGSRMRRTVP